MNHRHADFQSAALPPELPTRQEYKPELLVKFNRKSPNCKKISCPLGGTNPGVIFIKIGHLFGRGRN